MFDQDVVEEQLPEVPAFEQHYGVGTVARRWGFGVDVIRKIFAEEPGVMRVEKPETMHKRAYVSLRIPESVVRRVHARLTRNASKRVN